MESADREMLCHALVTLPMARSQGLLNVAAQKTFSSLRTSYAKRGRVLLSVGRAITANYWGDRLAIPQILLYVDVSPTPCSAVSPRLAAVTGLTR